MYVFVNPILQSDESIKQITTKIQITIWDLAPPNLAPPNLASPNLASPNRFPI